MSAEVQIPDQQQKPEPFTVKLSSYFYITQPRKVSKVVQNEDPTAHLMTKSMSLLAMVTTTSGTLYGVSRWLSMVALRRPR